MNEPDLSLPDESVVPRRSSMRALLGYSRPHAWMLGLILALTMASSAAALAQPLVIERVLIKMLSGESLRAEALLLFGLLVLSVALTYLQSWLSQRTAEGVVLQVRSGLVHRLIRLRSAELDRMEPGSLSTRVTADSTLVQQAATGGLVQLVDGSVHMVATVALMAWASIHLFGVTGVVMVVVGVAMGVVMPRIRKVTTQAQESVGEIGSALDRSLGAARTVKANGGEAVETARAVAAARGAYDAGLLGARYEAMLAVLSNLLVQGSFLAVIGLGGVFVARGVLDLPSLITFLLYLFNIGGPVLSLMMGFTLLQQGLGALERIEEVNDLEIEEDVDDVVPVPPARQPEVRFDGVSFAYAGRDEVLTDVSFTAPAGDVTALVGPSGSGKTTVFSLLQRFYDAQRGRVLLDGVDVTTLSRAELRRRIAYVEQDSPMLAGTIRENLLYAAPSSSEAEIADVLQRTLMADFVASLPEGLDTSVGTRGLALSGGQRQRLAIARALLRRPQVLLLDEVTAHLDGISERALQETLSQVSRQCTVLMIAHRLSTVAVADQLVLLQAGRVVDHGAHSALVGRSDLYRELTATQLVPTE